MVTIKDVARRANVSFTTVSHVVNKTRPVSRDIATSCIPKLMSSNSWLRPSVTGFASLTDETPG